MNRRVLAVVSAFLLAAFGTVVLVSYVESARKRAAAGEPVVQALVATAAIAKSTPVEHLAGQMALKMIPKKLITDANVTTLEPYKGKVTSVALFPGEPLLSHRLVTSEEAERGDIPPGLLEVTVSLPPERALGGHIERGDTVGVVATLEEPVETKFLLHKVLVSKVQATTAPRAQTNKTEEPDGADQEATETAPSGAFLVTLAVDAGAVERIVFAAEQGTLWLSAQPKEAGESTPGQKRETVLQ